MVWPSLSSRVAVKSAAGGVLSAPDGVGTGFVPPPQAVSTAAMIPMVKQGITHGPSKTCLIVFRTLPIFPPSDSDTDIPPATKQQSHQEAQMNFHMKRVVFAEDGQMKMRP